MESETAEGACSAAEQTEVNNTEVSSIAGLACISLVGRDGSTPCFGPPHAARTAFPPICVGHIDRKGPADLPNLVRSATPTRHWAALPPLGRGPLRRLRYAAPRWPGSVTAHA